MIQVDTVMVDQIELFPKEGEQIVTLKRNNGQWTVSNGSKEVKALSKSVKPILTQLNLIQAKR